MSKEKNKGIGTWQPEASAEAIPHEVRFADALAITHQAPVSLTALSALLLDVKNGRSAPSSMLLETPQRMVRAQLAIPTKSRDIT